MTGLVAALALSLLAAGEPGAPDDGQLLREPSGEPAIWFKAAGPRGAPVAIYLHGGPGYNAFAFERSVGKRLEKKLRMVYLDQRGGGRSPAVEDASRQGMDALVADVERVRVALGASKIALIAHSFGGRIALEYLTRYPQRVRGIVLVETTGDVGAALQHQLDQLAKVAPEAFPAQAKTLEMLARNTDPPSSKILRAYALLGRRGLQLKILFGGLEEAMERADDLDAGSGLVGKGNPRIFAQLQREGALDQRKAELFAPITVPAVLIAGKRSEAVGRENLLAASTAWKIPVIWLEDSAHFPYLDEPEPFARNVLSVLAP